MKKLLNSIQYTVKLMVRSFNVGANLVQKPIERCESYATIFNENALKSNEMNAFQRYFGV